MKLVTVILTVVSLGACNVEGPGAGEAKGGKKTEMYDIVEVSEVVKVEGPNGAIRFFGVTAVRFSSTNKLKITINEVDVRGDAFYNMVDSCLDKFVKQGYNPSSQRNVTVQKGIKKVNLKFDPPTTHDDVDGRPTGNLIEMEYTGLDNSDGELKTWKFKEGSIGKRLNRHGGSERRKWDPDCDEVSPSGEEEGSAAP